MSGNVNEWVQDVYRPLSFQDMDDLNPARRDATLDEETGYDENYSLIGREGLTLKKNGLPLLVCKNHIMKIAHQSEESEFTKEVLGQMLLIGCLREQEDIYLKIQQHPHLGSGVR